MNRQRNSTVASHASSEQIWSGPPTTGGTLIQTDSKTVPSYEDMFEEIQDSERPRPQDNDVFHIRTNDSILENQYSYSRTTVNSSAAYVSGTYRVRKHNYPYELWDSSSYGAQNTLASSPYGARGYFGLESILSDPLVGTGLNYKHEAAIQSLLPKIKPDISLLNDLYELKDFKRLPSLIRNIRSFIGSIPNLARGMKKGFGKTQTLRQITQLSSEAYLSDQFAIRPLLRSLMAMVGQADSIDRQIKNLVENAGKVRRKYYVSTIPTFFTESTGITNKNVLQFYGGINLRRDVYALQEPTFRACIEYSYRLPKISLLDLRKRLTGQRLGIQLNPKIIWDAIPWSFVVDWFANIGSLFQELHLDTLGIVTTIHRYVYSVKAARRVDCYVNASPLGPFDSGYFLVRRSTQFLYSRRVGVPDLARHLEVSGLNWKQFSYIGALIGARL